MKSAVAAHLPNTVHLHCLWHIMNVKKKCQGALGHKTSHLQSLLYACAYATSENTFDGVWAKLLEMVRDSACEAYLSGYLFGQRKHWARCYHPTAMTLGMAASSRVEGIFGVLKTRHVINRKSTLNWVKEELARRIKAIAVESLARAAKVPAVSIKDLEDKVLKSFEPMLKELGRVKVSHYAHKKMLAELRTSTLYDTAVLAEGNGANDYLRGLAEHSSDHHDVCREVPEEGFDDDYDPLGAKFGATSLPAFHQLVEHVQLTAVVKVVFRYENESANIVVVGPDGFQLCTCLQVLRCGLPCRHVLVALFTRLQRAVEFNGDSIHPRWRSSGDEWSIHRADLSVFDGHERGTYDGGFTDDFGGIGMQDDTHVKRSALDAVIIGKMHANMMETCIAAIRGVVDHYDVNRPNYYDTGMEVTARFLRDAQALMRGPLPSRDPNNISAILNPLDSSVRSKKESRHRDCTELRPSRKRPKATSVATKSEKPEWD